ncbi:MAG TPA: hypothetical protein VGZ72_05730 [Stellaceae bacterium]|nr:hypothetical protein [Stellaceae bacterium]
MSGTGQDGLRAKSRWWRRGLALALTLGGAGPALADYRITRDHGGEIKSYEAKYTHLRDKGERVIIDGICNSACTLLLGILPPGKVCVTPRASLGFHQAYFDQRWTAGIKVISYAGTAELMGYYPQSVKEWIARHGGLTTQMKKVTNGRELWALVDPCPDEF